MKYIQDAEKKSELLNNSENMQDRRKNVKNMQILKICKKKKNVKYKSCRILYDTL